MCVLTVLLRVTLGWQEGEGGGVVGNLLLSGVEFTQCFKYGVVYVYVCVIHV
jgi:hypothetical protein